VRLLDTSSLVAAQVRQHERRPRPPPLVLEKAGLRLLLGGLSLMLLEDASCRLQTAHEAEEVERGAAPSADFVLMT